MVMSSASRRAFLRQGSLGATALVMGGGALLLTACDPTELGAVDANGVMLPPGFRSRVIATTGEVVGSTGYVWHPDPDGGACFPLADGGWSYVSNCEADGAGRSSRRTSLQDHRGAGSGDRHGSGCARQCGSDHEGLHEAQRDRDLEAAHRIATNVDAVELRPRQGTGGDRLERQPPDHIDVELDHPSIP